MASCAYSIIVHVPSITEAKLIYENNPGVIRPNNLIQRHASHYVSMLHTCTKLQHMLSALFQPNSPNITFSVFMFTLACRAYGKPGPTIFDPAAFRNPVTVDQEWSCPVSHPTLSISS